MARAKRKPAKARAPKRKRGAKATKAKKRSNLLGGVAKGIAWIGNKVRGVVARKPKKKAKKKTKPKAPKKVTRKAPASEVSLVTLHNPLP